ncbi:MAG: TIGR02266 family protein [Candidatus Rokubacteria bacterium]|nr:TIGR02266 family protein [Candidatus Rokubacteria bacterium]
MPGTGAGEEQGGTPPAERRSQARVSVSIQIHYQTVDAVFTEFATNISEGGVYIESAVPLPVGTRVTIEFFLPNRPRPIQVSGEVVRVNDEGTERIPRGMAIGFEPLDAQTKAEINAFVRSLRRPD